MCITSCMFTRLQKIKIQGIIRLIKEKSSLGTKNFTNLEASGKTNGHITESKLHSLPEFLSRIVFYVKLPDYAHRNISDKAKAGISVISSTQMKTLLYVMVITVVSIMTATEFNRRKNDMM